MAEYRRWAQMRVEVLNYALEGIPPEQVRYHICWGSWHGPHSTDVPLKDVVDIMMRVSAHGYSGRSGERAPRARVEGLARREAARRRVVIPGVVSHATNVAGAPGARRGPHRQYADVVGRENVIAGTDCGLGGRIHPQLAWAKLRALSEGAALASKELWGR